jgi:hypothetical protein
MKTTVSLALALCLTSAFPSWAQLRVPFDRLPVDRFEVASPADRVGGELGTMRVSETGCRVLPIAGTRRRLVDVAVQEWGFFGFPISDQTGMDDEFDRPTRGRGRRFGLDSNESLRVAASIGGYWSSTSDGSWIIERQNQSWNGSSGISSRWRDPWSAAFISWVMCEGGLGESVQFRRAIAHHTYIDQAIQARDGRAPNAAFVAYDVGEATVEPGDLLCSARRPGYGSIAERRRQMGEGARTHCDLVVKVDEREQRILAIGGNVGSAVSLKVIPAERHGDIWKPGGGRRPMFAHLKLRADSIEMNALDSSPTLRALGCGIGVRTPAHTLALAFADDVRAVGTFC